MLVVLGICLWAGISLVAVSEDSVVAVCQLLIAVASLVAEQGLQGAGCSLYRGLIALQHVGSSQIRNRTHISCMGRQLLCH